MSSRGHPLKDMEKITIRVPASYLQKIDFLVEAEDFQSRSEAIRFALRDMLDRRLEVVLGQMDKLRLVQERMKHVEEVKKEYLRR